MSGEVKSSLILQKMGAAMPLLGRSYFSLIIQLDLVKLMVDSGSVNTNRCFASQIRQHGGLFTIAGRVFDTVKLRWVALKRPAKPGHFESSHFGTTGPKAGSKRKSEVLCVSKLDCVKIIPTVEKKSGKG